MHILKLRWLVVLGALLASVAGYPAFASAAVPKPVQAYYMYGTTLSSLTAGAYSDGCDFASTQPDAQTDIMLLDFGAPRIVAGQLGAVDFANTAFTNNNILQALESAADGYHDCHVRGAAIIEYGNSNYRMSGVGMTSTDAWNAGFQQEATVQQLSNYQDAQGYASQGAGAAGDLEPSYDGPAITKQLVNGATAQGFAVYDNFGSVDGCPTSGTSNGPCNNGWDVSDVGYVSFHGLAVPLPEIYYTVSAGQWTVVRKVWNASHTSSYFFDGITGETPAPSGGVSATTGWSTLNSKNSGYVGDNIVCYGSGC